MNREQALSMAAVLVIVFALLIAVLGPGVVADPTDRGPTRPGPIDIADLTISPAGVSGETTTLEVTTHLRHRGNPTPNVTLRYRAIDSRSGLLETTETVAVGDVVGKKEISVPVNLTVEREGGYRIEVLVYQDGQRIARGSRTVSGLEALTPKYARTSVGFEARGQLPAISTSVRDVGPNRTQLDISAWLTNNGNDAAGDLRVTIILRQADSNLVAARESTSVGRIAGGRTATTEVRVSVPAGYNYYIDAILWKDDVIVDTVRSVVNLDPQERITANTTTRDVELEISDFESQRGGEPEPRATEGAVPAASSPGFGVVVAVIALIAIALLTRRWDR